MFKNLDLNDEFNRALDLLENTRAHVFISGRAGTGKSTLLEYFRGVTSKRVVVLASTGVAAVNVKGETIHSFFGFKPGVTLDKIRVIRSRRADLYKEIDTVIIDEISMVRADLLDCVDKFLRLNARDIHRPFGSVQMVFIGDLYQLPPVLTADEKDAYYSKYKSIYFFGSDAFRGLPVEFVELVKIYRQKDEEFIDILNAVRDNTVNKEHLDILNRKVVAGMHIEDFTEHVYLTPANRTASLLNNDRLEGLGTELHVYKGEMEGDFSGKYLPTDAELSVKVGAQVMLLNNDNEARWVNGTIGKVVDIRRDLNSSDIIIVEIPGNKTVEIGRHKWELFRFKLNENSRDLESEVVGAFVQYPLKLAWAITIHKSQGKTFEKIILDTTSGIFATGQVYVALSRSRSLDGVILKKPLTRRDIRMNSEIVDFFKDFRAGRYESKGSLAGEIDIFGSPSEEERVIELD
ncbi:MAG: AAA family ATPase [Candidatus Omnitrophica bacterium]|nr:AAA family ATPase [Candidatus Omnitrophota bacterium]